MDGRVYWAEWKFIKFSACRHHSHDIVLTTLIEFFFWIIFFAFSNYSPLLIFFSPLEVYVYFRHSVWPSDSICPGPTICNNNSRIDIRTRKQQRIFVSFLHENRNHRIFVFFFFFIRWNCEWDAIGKVVVWLLSFFFVFRPESQTGSGTHIRTLHAERTKKMKQSFGICTIRSPLFALHNLWAVRVNEHGTAQHGSVSVTNQSRTPDFRATQIYIRQCVAINVCRSPVQLMDGMSLVPFSTIFDFLSYLRSIFMLRNGRLRFGGWLGSRDRECSIRTWSGHWELQQSLLLLLSLLLFAQTRYCVAPQKHRRRDTD